jgi:hypothetical protein
MAGTNERRSVVEDGWEPITPEKGRVAPLLIAFAVAMVVVPALAFYATYLLMSR